MEATPPKSAVASSAAGGGTPSNSTAGAHDGRGRAGLTADAPAYHERTMENLSGKARAAQQALRDASAAYQTVVERVIEDPRGPFSQRLREAEERVAETAASWALEYAEGAEPTSGT